MQIAQNWRETFPTLTDRSTAPLYYLVGTMALYAILTPALYRPYESTVWHIVAYTVLALVALGGAGVRYSVGTRAYAIILKTIVALCLFYVLASRIDLAPGLGASQPLVTHEFVFGWYVAVACGVIAFFRPSFAIVPMAYIIWQKQQLTAIFGLHIDWMDYFTVIESGTLLVLGLLFLDLLQKRFGSLDFEHSFVNQSRHPSVLSIHPANLLVLLAVALHFGNYFYAGAIKLGLGLQHPLFWVLDNPTQTLLPAALESGVLPISFSSWLSESAYTIMVQGHVLSNLMTVLIQLFAVVAIARVRWAIITTILYDVLHVGIFVVTGIFFWKFIILNLAIVAALSTLRIPSLPRRLKLFFCSTVILSPFVFQIMPSFAWLDSPSMNSIHIIAVTDDSSEYRVPSNYFLSSSVTFAQHRAIWPGRGPLTSATWGTSRNAEMTEKGRTCDWGYEDGDLPIANWFVEKDRISSFVQRHHHQILSMVNDRGLINYDLFPHHIFTMPWEFTDFKALDKRRISKYRYEISTLCLSYENGNLNRDVMWSTQFDIPLGGPGGIR